MTKDDFRNWYRSFAARFPAVSNWLAGLDNAAEVLEAWQETLAETDLDDAREVLRRWTEQDGEAIGTTDQERQAVARRVRHEAREAARQRRQSQRLLSAEGRATPEDEPRYRCHKCRDRGLVTVIDPVHFNVRGLIYDNLVVRCDCAEAERFSKERQGVNGKVYPVMQQYDRSRHFRCMDGVTKSVREEFHAWLGQRRQLQAEAMSNYEPGFAEFNEGAPA